MAPKGWFPETLTGDLVVLRRHVARNVAAFRRWYADPEIARLARYQPSPMRPEEIDRFFEARVVGPDALAMAVHEKDTNRLVGTCAFSQLDGENGSALYHITIGEPDVWGRGYGTEATRLMLGHAFGTLSLHRIALFVFEFNVRAIRAYKRCGFVVEGRSRESIWRDGRWWDELAMSVLESDWRQMQGLAPAQARPAAAGSAGTEPAGTEPARTEPAEAPGTQPIEAPGTQPAEAPGTQPIGAGASDRLRRTIGRWR